MNCKEKPGDLELDFFYEIYQAPPAEKDWALSNCCSLADCWNRLPAKYLIWLATRPHVLSDADQYRLAAYCCRMIKHLVRHPVTNRVIQLTEARARGRASVSKINELFATLSELPSALPSASEPFVHYAATCCLMEALNGEAWSAASCAADQASHALSLCVPFEAAVAEKGKAQVRIANYIRRTYKPRFNWKIHRRSSNYWGPPSLDPGVPEAAFQEVNPND